MSRLLVGGIGGRLAMMLLARLAPEATGVRSDDNFLIGQFTLLRPPWLAIALFVAIPGLCAALLTVLCERWLHPDGRIRQALPRVVT